MTNCSTIKSYKGQPSKTRDVTLDMVAGILMLFTMMHHYRFPYFNGLYSIATPLGFFMPWFFFKAGMFVKPQRYSEKFFVGVFKRLCAPLLFFIFFSILNRIFINVFILGSTFHNELSSLLSTPLNYIENANTTLWFLFAFLITKVVFLGISNSPKQLVILFSVLMLFLFSISIGTEPYSLLHFIFNCVSGLFYYSLGYLLKDNKLDGKYIWLMVAVYLVAVFALPSGMDMRLHYVIRGNFWLALFYNIAGIIIINAFISRLNMKFNYGLITKIFKYLSLIGRYSMGVYLLHIVIRWYVDTIHFSHNVFNSMLDIVLALLILPATIYFLKRTRFAWIIGETKGR